MQSGSARCCTAATLLCGVLVAFQNLLIFDFVRITPVSYPCLVCMWPPLDQSYFDPIGQQMRLGGSLFLVHGKEEYVWATPS